MLTIECHYYQRLVLDNLNKILYSVVFQYFYFNVFI